MSKNSSNTVMATIPQINLTKANAVEAIRSQCQNKDMCIAYTLITPEVAKELLSLESEQRRQKPGNIETLAGYIKEQQWQLIPYPVTFSRKGALIDGSHRLRAIILAHMPAFLMIVCAAPHRIQKVLDQGISRSVGDILDIDGYKGIATPIHTSTLTAMIIESPASTKVRIPKLASAELTKHYFSLIDAVIKMYKGPSGKGLNKGKCASVIAPIVRAYATYKDDPVMVAKIERFVDIISGYLFSGLRENEGSACRLRSWLIQSSSGQTRPLKRVIYRKTENALWQYLRGEKCESLTQTMKECFPLKVTSLIAPYFDNGKEYVMRHDHKRLTQKPVRSETVEVKAIE